MRDRLHEILMKIKSFNVITQYGLDALVQLADTSVHTHTHTEVWGLSLLNKLHSQRTMLWLERDLFC